MSKNAKKVSDAGQGDRKGDSVYDFLYCDSRRIGSFLAQFDASGHLQQVTQRESVSKGNKRGMSLKLGGGASYLGTGGTGEVAFERGPGETGSEESELVFDPLWTNALTFLDYLDDRDIIAPDIVSAGIGRFVLFTGALMVLDTAFQQRLYQLPAVRKQTYPQWGINPQTGKKFTREEIDLEYDVLRELAPHVQAHVTNDLGHKVWGTLRPDNLVTPPNELMLKHGSVVDGEWAVLGIKDAEPIDDVQLAREEADRMKAPLDDLYKFTSQSIELNLRARFWLGRPHYCYGITPLAIFREIG